MRRQCKRMCQRRTCHDEYLSVGQKRCERGRQRKCPAYMAQTKGIMTVEQETCPSGKLDILSESCKRKRIAHNRSRLSADVTTTLRRVEHAGTLRLSRVSRLLHRDTALSDIAQ